MTQSDDKKSHGMWGLLIISGAIAFGNIIPVLIDMVEDVINLIF